MLGVSELYDTGRNRRLLERPAQSKVGRLLLQGRPPCDSAEALEVDGLDSQLCPSERDSGDFVHECSDWRSPCDGESKRRRVWRDCSYRSFEHPSRMLAFRLFIINQTMESLTPNKSPEPTPIALSVPHSRA